ncbi:perilipin-2-like isoform X1 [Gadus chalcogrammus]|uniref:perilipin-2-like isoform X1 n=1 Tax=Gadus chalcogrammus TaxID=1042646 RepID=UPI0024C4C791|nr:perilipin-2-like isoform X1 [Gadus chalcogrammus]
MSEVEVVSNQSAMGRVSSLPLVSSTYGLVLGAYCSTRDHHPVLASVCRAAERGVWALTSVAMTTAQPLIGRLEPQLAIANQLACKGLDQIEKTLPILQQPSDQIVSNATGAVAVARETVSGRLRGAVDRTKAVVSGGVDRTKAVVSGGVDKALSTSEDLIEHYLPPGPEETELESGPTGGPEGPSYYGRLGTLSTRLRSRAYGRALARVRGAKQRSHEAIAQLPHTGDLFDFARRNVGGANRKVYNTLSSLVERRISSSPRGQEENEDPNTEVAEPLPLQVAEPLPLAASLSQQLQTTCLTLASGLQGLPRHLQREARSLGRSASGVYASLTAAGVGALPEGALAGGKARLGQVKRSLDQVLDYLVNNTPLNWLVGPFYPRLPSPARPGESTPEVAAPPPPPPAQTTESPEDQSPSSRDPSPQRGGPSPWGPVVQQQEVWGAEMQTMDSLRVAFQH